MPRAASPFVELRRRLEVVEDQAGGLLAEGLPFPTTQQRADFDEAVREGTVPKATRIVKRAEALLVRATRDWGWVRELLRRVDELRSIADTIGVDVALVDARVGNPRAQLMAEPLGPGSLEKTAASASLALAVLDDVIPKFCLQEAKALGDSIRRARDRGEDVRDAVGAFSRLLISLQDEHLPSIAERVAESRRVVARIPRAPSVPSMSAEEEEEILLEARNLARRLHRIKSKAHDASGAVRLMGQVRQALSEERRYGTPEEEIEALWSEVDRLTKEKKLAASGPPLELPPLLPEPLPAAPPLPAEPAPTISYPRAPLFELDPSLDPPPGLRRIGAVKSAAEVTRPAIVPEDAVSSAMAPPPPPPLPPAAPPIVPREPRTARIPIALAYVPPSSAPSSNQPEGTPPPGGPNPPRRPRSRHRE